MKTEVSPGVRNLERIGSDARVGIKFNRSGTEGGRNLGRPGGPEGGVSPRHCEGPADNPGDTVPVQMHTQQGIT